MLSDVHRVKAYPASKTKLAVFHHMDEQFQLKGHTGAALFVSMCFEPVILGYTRCFHSALSDMARMQGVHEIQYL